MSNYILHDYDRNLERIVNEGFDIDDDRTGVGTINLFNLSATIDVSERMPILTKRRVAWKSIVKEVLWYISGSSNIKDLEDMDCGIWTPWKNEKFSSKHGFEEGSAGYVYGYNLIHYGADLLNKESKGFNQLDYVIDTLKANPKSRQACFTFWRPDTNNQAVLPACHAFYTFIVSKNADGDLKDLNVHVFQRSNDYPIGVGMGNLFTAALFLHLIAHQTNLNPKYVYHTGAHCHVYKNALEATKEYISRRKTPDSPILHINHKDSIYEYSPDDFSIESYEALDRIKFDIAV